MDNKICSFFGHREIAITESLINSIKNCVIDLIENKGFSTFYFGGFGNFDDLCHKIVSEMKLLHPQVKRVFCLSEQKPLSSLPKWLKDDEYEQFIYLDLDFDYWYRRIYFRNCKMVEQSDLIIFYVNENQDGGAKKTFSYAKKLHKQYINLATR